MGIASQSNIIRILSGYNQWWHLRSVQKQFLKPTHRTAYGEIVKLLDDEKIRGICALKYPVRLVITLGYGQDKQRQKKRKTIDELVEQM